MRVSLLLRLAVAFQTVFLLASLFLPSLALGAVRTDQDDYAPGSVVTISGDNSDGAGYLPGEAVDVVVSGPNGYAASCSATVDDAGAWSCQVTLWDTWLAVGAYSYTATGRDSGVSQNGTFTDAFGTSTTLTSSLNPSSSGQSVTFTATVTFNGSGGGPAAGTAVTVGSVIFGENGNVNCGGGGFVQLQGPQTPDASGHVTFTTSGLGVASHTIRACYTGTGGSSGTSNSNDVVTQTVGAPVATTTAVVRTVGTSPITFGSALTFRATVSGTPSPGSAGTMTFKSGATTLCSAVALTSNVALCSPSLNVGSYSITAEYSGGTSGGTIWASSTSGALAQVVQQASSTTTVTCTGSPFTFDGDPHGCTASATGAGGLNQSLTITYTGVSGTTYGPSTTAPTGAGDYTAGASFGGDTNHTGSSGSENFLIAQASSTTTVTCTGSPFTFDGDPHGCTASATGAGGLNQSLTITYTGVSGTTYGPSTTAPTGAGDYTAGASFGGDTNHTGSSGSENFLIAQASSTTTVTCTGSPFTFDGDPHGCTASATGAGGLNQSLTITYTGVSGTTYGPSTTAPTGAGDYTAGASFGGDTNHTGSSGSENYTIQQAGSITTIVCTGEPFTYTASPHGCTASATGAGALNQSLSVTYTGVSGTTYGPSATAPSGAGDYRASASFGGDANHTGSSTFEDFTIAKADAVCSIGGYSGTYDAGFHGASGSCSGVDAGGTAAGSSLALGSTFKDYPGGTAHWTFTGGTNYNDQSDDVAITIAKADAVCSIGGYSGTYDAGFHGASGSCSGVDAGGTAAGSSLALGSTFKDYPGGTAHWTFTGGTNYNDQSDDVAITIAKADAVCSIGGYSGTYDAGFHGASGSCSGVDAGGTAAGSSLALGSTFKDYPGGTAHWTFTGGTNYNDQSDDVAITIAKADAVCSIGGYSGTYDAGFHGASGSCSGVDAGGTAAGSSLALGSTFKDYPGGTAHWTFTGGTNYNDQSDDVAITIAKADAVCSIGGYSGTYDAGFHGASGSCSGVDAGGTAAGSSLALGSTFKDYPGGTAHWTFTGGTNYNDQSDDVAITISQKTVYGSFTVANKIFDTTTGATILTRGLSGVISPEVCTLSGGTTAFPVSDVGTWTLTLVGAILTGPACGNYRLASTDITTTASITAWNAQGKGFYEPVGVVNSVFTAAPAHEPIVITSGLEWNVAKGGSTIPLKFNVFAGVVEKTSLADIESFNQSKMASCAGGSGSDQVEELPTTGGTTLRYDGSFWIQNWKTPKVTADTCYRAWVTFADGSSLEAFFKLRK